MRYAARVDENQAEIVHAVRQVGASVSILSSVGDGFPDLAIGWRGKNLLWETKDGKKPPSQRKLTAAQVKWHREWKGSSTVVESRDQALQILSMEAL